MGDQDTLDEFVVKKAEGGLTKEERADISKRTRELRDVNVNLAYARMAVSFVKQRVPLVANWDERLDTSFEHIFGVSIAASQSRAKSQGREISWLEEKFAEAAGMSATWDKADRCVYWNLRQDSEWQTIDHQPGGVRDLQDIQILSDLADQHGCGNCGELTAITFMYLYHLNIRPLDFLVLKDPADHAFVVIGRNGSDEDDNYGRNWGKSAVVCDPWAYGLKIPLPAGISGPIATFGDSFVAYSAALLEQNMKAMHTNFSGVELKYFEE